MAERVRCRPVRSEVSFAPRRSTVSPVLGGLLALSYPTILVAVALGVGFRRGGDMGDFAATIAAAVVFLIAAPTAWILAFPFIEVTRFTVVVFGAVSSSVLWWLLGVAVARGAESWVAWVRQYGLICVGWTALNILGIGLIAAASG